MMQYLEEALSECETIVTQSATAGASEWMSACQTVGNILSGMGFIEESYSWQTMALAIEPSAVNFYLATGRVYGYCQNWKKAAYFCERIIEQRPHDAEAYCRLAKVYHEMGDYKAEGETIHTLLSQQPEKTNPDGHFQLGKVMETHGLLPQAQRCYQQAIEQDPEFAIAYYALTDLFAQQGDAQAAIPLLKQLTAQLEDDAMAHYRLGRAYKQAQQYQTAILSFRQALKLDPDLHWAYMGLLNSLLQLQRWDETIESCRGIIHFVGEFPWAYCFLGNALAKKGEKLEAAKSHQKAFELRGWKRCVEQDYRFTHTWFSESISLWERHLLPLLSPAQQSDLQSNSQIEAKANAEATTSQPLPLRMLLLGSGDESSLCWLADEILQQPDDRLVCITERVSQSLSENLAKLPEAEKVSIETGEIAELLALLRSATTEEESADESKREPITQQLFDVIYIQSDRKQGSYLNCLARQSWPLLKPGGLLFFKDYQWQHPQDPSQSSKPGIDAFIQTFVAPENVLHRTHQVIVKKESKLSA